MELYVRDIWWDIDTDQFDKRFLGEKLAVGDKVRIIPCCYIDHYEETSDDQCEFKHIVDNIYKFTFNVVAKYHNYQRKQCFHYLIKIANFLECFHFNWLKPLNNYLQVGKSYIGYGALSTCGDPSTENRRVKGNDIQRIIKMAAIKQILVTDDNTEYFANRGPWEEGKVYTEESRIRKLGYPEAFLANLPGYKPIRTFRSMAEKKHDESIVFGILLDS